MNRISRSSHKPIYLQICDIIREKIDTGEIAPGSRVWSENDIIEKFNVSRNTARKAIETLAIEGIVSRVQGKGSFVRKPKVEYGLHHLTSFSEEIIMKGLKPSSKVIRLNREHPNYYHANRLKVPLDSWVFRLERIRMADDCPIGYQITFVPEKLCPDLSNYDFSKESLYDISEKIYNHVLSWQETIVKPVIANDHLAQMLNIRPRSPLLLTESISYLAGGTPFESNFNFYLSERYQFTVLSYRQNSINAAEEK